MELPIVNIDGTTDHEAKATLYRALYETHVKSDKLRARLSILSGVLSIVSGILILKKLRDENA